MKYESELIHEILEQRGHEFPDLHYQSECVESWIEEAKGAYPKLCDYESEWLNYINENPIGEFPYETITTNHTATVNHVVPFAYKSAILKGNTLVNIFDNWVNNDGTLTPVKTQDGYFLFTGSNGYAKVNLDDIPTFKRGVEYTFIYRIKNSTYDGKNNNTLRLEVGATTIYAHTVTNGIWKIKKSFSTDETNCFVKILSWTGSTGSAEVSLQIIEGDYTNVDIPYFEGMQSVKMPVLTTSNVIQSVKFEKLKPDLSNGSLTPNESEDSSSGCIEYFDISKLSNAKFVFKSTQPFTRENYFTFLFYDKDKTYIKWLNGQMTKIADGLYTCTIPTVENAKYLRIIKYDRETQMSNIVKNSISAFVDNSLSIDSTFSIKSNILSTPSDLELRGVGDVKDKLNLLTGELTQRIGEIVLDGTEDWQKDGYTGYFISMNDLIRASNYQQALTSDRLPIGELYTSTYTSPTLSGYTNNSSYPNQNWLYIVGTEFSTVDELKTWLNQNPTTVQYQLSTESIKTINLTVVNQDGDSLSKIKPIEGTMHIIVSGTPINPTAILEVPVEAITQNLASFIETEE